MSKYYEIDKPFSRENWNTLIEDLNELFENPPGNCAAIEPLEEVDEEHIWTKQDVEDVHEKLEEMCPENEFEEDLDKPWRTAIIDEIENNMEWCDCGIDEYTLRSTYFALGVCTQDRILCEDMTFPISDIIDGMFVGKVNYKWYSYQVVIFSHSTDNDAEYASKKEAYEALKEPGDPPFEATYEGSHCCGQTWMTGGYIWCDGIIHSTAGASLSECEYNYINYRCIPNPDGSPIIDAANEAFLAAAEQQLADYETEGRWFETILRVFSHQAVPCEPSDPYYQEDGEEGGES